MANNVEITILLDFYGEMLTQKQRDFLGYYYNDDLSLSEIAENEGIKMESKLVFAKRLDQIRDHLQQIIECAESINAYNLDHGLSREINETTVRIKSLALDIIE